MLRAPPRTGYGFRGPDGNADTLAPLLEDSQPYAYGDYDWGATRDGTTVNGGYHQFTCSKCHNPHASRLPKLLITNCLDTKHNTWHTAAAVGSPGSVVSSGENNNADFSNATSAQNCHRYQDPGQSGTFGDGWNVVSPW